MEILDKVEKALMDVIEEFEIDIESCSEHELLRYNGAIEGLQLGIFRVRLLK